MAGRLEIRLATDDDAPSIASVLHESFIEYRSSYTDEAFAATAPAGDVVRRRMEEGPVWVALLNDVIVGTVSGVSRDDALYVRGMAVLPAARGQSVGAALLSHIECAARAHRYRRLLLDTTPFLTRAIQLYERAEFRRSGDGLHDLFGTPLFTMVKSLDRGEG